MTRNSREENLAETQQVESVGRPCEKTCPKSHGGGEEGNDGLGDSVKNVEQTLGVYWELPELKDIRYYNGVQHECVE